MRKIDLWLSEYSASHQHPINKLLHFISVPLIMMSVLVILVSSLSVLYSVIIGVALVSFYLVLSRQIIFGILALLLVELGAVYWIYHHVQVRLWIVSVGIFVLGWGLQFLGHYIEGSKPSFMKNLIFLFIGPVWVVAPFYRLLRAKF